VHVDTLDCVRFYQCLIRIEGRGPEFVTRQPLKAPFYALATNGLDQVRLLVDRKKAVLSFYVVFDNPDLVVEIVS
jgi:hypothetical protein